MIGGLGNDTYIVNATGDTITENASEGTDLVQSSVSFTLGTNIENLTLLGAGSINGIGNSLGNVITGDIGDNSLYGGDDIADCPEDLGHNIVPHLCFVKRTPLTLKRTYLVVRLFEQKDIVPLPACRFI